MVLAGSAHAPYVGSLGEFGRSGRASAVSIGCFPGCQPQPGARAAWARGMEGARVGGSKSIAHAPTGVGSSGTDNDHFFLLLLLDRAVVCKPMPCQCRNAMINARGGRERCGPAHSCLLYGDATRKLSILFHRAVSRVTLVVGRCLLWRPLGIS